MIKLIAILGVLICVGFQARAEDKSVIIDPKHTNSTVKFYSHFAGEVQVLTVTCAAGYHFSSGPTLAPDPNSLWSQTSPSTFQLVDMTEHTEVIAGVSGSIVPNTTNSGSGSAANPIAFSIKAIARYFIITFNEPSESILAPSTPEVTNKKETTVTLTNAVGIPVAGEVTFASALGKFDPEKPVALVAGQASATLVVTDSPPIIDQSITASADGVDITDGRIASGMKNSAKKTVPKITVLAADGGPAPSSVKRDQIVELMVKIEKLSTNMDVSLSVTPDTMSSETLGSRGSVQMYDFGVIANGKVKALQTKITVPPSGEQSFQAVFNKSGTLQVKATASVDDQTITVFSPHIEVTSRIRQYAEKEDPQNSMVNAYDSLFQNAASLWPDWRYGKNGLNYTFKSTADRYAPELLKAIAFKETQMNATNAAHNGAPATDIMQVSAGLNNGVLSAMNTQQNDWNSSATPVHVTDKDKGDQLVFLVDESRLHNPPDNCGVIRMFYAGNSPGPANAASEAASVQWAVRELLYKQLLLRKCIFILRTPFPTSYASDPPVLSLESTLDAYGTGVGYHTSVLKLETEGRGAHSDSEYVWPILTDMKARH